MVLHVNDTHSHLEPVSVRLGVDGEDVYVEMGGFARLWKAIDALREEKRPMVLLHGGDAVQGTLYFNVYHGQAEFDFMNAMGFQAMVLGNHEFDGGPGTLCSFYDMARFPMLAANVIASADSGLEDRIRGHVILHVGNGEIGVIGLITRDTPNISQPGNSLTFLDEREAARRAVHELETQGVSTIVVLSHMGYEQDKDLAREVEGIDVVVGGHSHSLLGGIPGLGKAPEGPYPTIVMSPSGNHVCVVQAWEWAKVLGVLDVRLDAEGVVTACTGSAVAIVGDTFRRKNPEGGWEALDPAARARMLTWIEAHPDIAVVREDPRALAKLAVYRAGLDRFGRHVVARVPEDLWHVRVPGTVHPVTGKRMPQGSLVAPIVCEAMLWKTNSVGLKVRLALENAGSVRTDLPAGDLTVAGVYELLPFENTLYVLDVSGSTFRQAVEAGVSRSGGAFPYVGGARYTVDESRPRGHRVVRVEVREEDGSWVGMDDRKIYRMTTNSYLAQGHDGYTVLEETGTYRYDTGFVDTQAFMEYAGHAGVLRRPETTGVSCVSASP